MKVTIDVDCTPEEARAFLGLPDVAPLQEDMMNQMRSQMTAAAEAMNPDQMMKTLFPLDTEGLAAMQKKFWSSLAAGAADGSAKKS